jgi:glutathione S-transferase
MGLTFYYQPMTSATRVHWALEELGVAYDKVKIDLSKRENKNPDYLAQNPNGKVPLLVADGVPIFESLAILLYLGERYGAEKKLFPGETDYAGRGEALKWMCWGSVTVVETVMRIMRNTSDRFPAEERNEKAAQSAKLEMAGHLAMIDHALEGRDYMLGAEFSLVDVANASLVPFIARNGVDTTPFSRVNDWVGRCIARPAFARVMTS